MTLAAMQGLASRLLVLSALRENAVPVLASSRTTEQHAEVQVDSVTYRNTAVESLQSVRQMCTNETEQHATMARPTASLESARHTMTSASTTLEPVSIGYKFEGVFVITLYAFPLLDNSPTTVFIILVSHIL